MDSLTFGMDADLNLCTGDRQWRAEAMAEPISDGKVLLCCASTSPVRMESDQVGWLDMAGADLTMLNTGRAPLIMGHRSDVESLLGIIERAWIDGPRLLAVARFARSRFARETMRLVFDRVLCNASIGMACRIDREPDDTGARRLYWWRPYEVSLVVLPRNWDARVLDIRVPLRVRSLLAHAAAEAAGGTPESWKDWAASAATGLAAAAGVPDAVAFEGVLTKAVEAELQRLAADAALGMQAALDVITDLKRRPYRD